MPPNAAVEHTVVVPDRGPVARVGVFVRIAHPRARDLTLTLISPAGTRVVLARRRGAGRDFGAGDGCREPLTAFRDNFDMLIRQARSPFVVDRPYAPEQPLARVNGEEARGRWTLRIHNAGFARGSLLCWRLEVSRDLVHASGASAGRVRATVSFRELDDVYRDVRVKITRYGRVLLDTELRLGRSWWRPVGRPLIRRLDRDAEPEIVADVYSGGAHCCTSSFIYRYEAARGIYVRTAHDWKNLGYRLVDLDRDGRPEFSSHDDFSYAFAPYAGSVHPIQIWQFERGRMLDVTRRFRAAIARDAAQHWRLYLRIRGSGGDVRGVLPAWLADQLLLGRGAHGWRALEHAYRRGELGRSATKDGYPAGRRYLAFVRRFLRERGYLR